MAPAVPPDLSLAGALLMAAAWWLGPELAPYVSTYSLILIGWGAGLMVGIWRRPPDGRRLPIAGFAAVSLVASLGLTVPATQLVASNAGMLIPGASGSFNAGGWFIGMAAAIPAIGHNWPQIFAAVGEWLRRRIFGGGNAR
jgi:hypothetical protein